MPLQWKVFNVFKRNPPFYNDEIDTVPAIDIADQIESDYKSITPADHDTTDRNGYESKDTHSKKDEHENFSQKKYNIFKGILYSALSGFFFSLCSVIVKYVKDIDTGELAMLRFLGLLVFTLPAMTFNVTSNPFGPKNMRLLLFFRGIIGTTNLYLTFLAFRNLPLADASVIVFSSPVFVSLLAKVFLKESCGFVQSISIIIAMLGLLFTSKLMLVSTVRNYSQGYYLGMFSAFVTVFLGSVIFIILGKLKHINHFIILFNFSYVAIAETVIITSLFGHFSLPACGEERILVILIGLFSFLGQSFITASFQFEQAGPISVVRSATDIVLSFIWQIVIFKDVPDFYSVIGAIMVISSVFLITIRKWVLTLDDNSELRRKFKCLTL